MIDYPEKVEENLALLPNIGRDIFESEYSRRIATGATVFEAMKAGIVRANLFDIAQRQEVGDDSIGLRLSLAGSAFDEISKLDLAEERARGKAQAGA